MQQIKQFYKNLNVSTETI